MSLGYSGRENARDGLDGFRGNHVSTELDQGHAVDDDLWLRPSDSDDVVRHGQVSFTIDSCSMRLLILLSAMALQMRLELLELHVQEI